MFRVGPACLEVVDKIEGDLVFLGGADAGRGTVLQQQYVAVLPEELRDAVAGQWLPIWQRDEGAANSLDQWPAFQELCRALPGGLPRLDVNMLDVSLWQRSIRQMGLRRAVGVCGWSPAELKQLPIRALQQLVALFDLAVRFDLPPHLLEARISVLAKTHSPKSIGESRPITVFSTLYRIWSSTLTRLPWPPLEHILCQLQVPAPLVKFWLRSLGRVKRFPALGGSLTEPLQSQNDAPEIDPFSVAAMAGVCYFVDKVLQGSQLQFRSYVDNWSWTSSSRDALLHDLPTALGALEALRVPVDWRKSYTWAYNTTARQWWHDRGVDCFPVGVRVQVVTNVKESGVLMQLGGCTDTSARQVLLDGGLQRLQRLEKQPRPLEKASAIQGAVWPSCLYGCEALLWPL